MTKLQPWHLCDAAQTPEILILLADAGVSLKQRVIGVASTGPETPGSIGHNASLLHYAASSNVVDSAALLIESGCNINATDDRGQTALIIAAASQKAAVVSYLVSHGADVDIKSVGGWTALHHAACRGATEIVRLLLAHGAESLTLNDGSTPMTLAAQEILPGRCDEHIERLRCVITILEEAGCNKDLLTSIATEDTERIGMLLDSNEHLARGRDSSGVPFLLYAVEFGSLTIVKTLVECDADPNTATLVDSTNSLHCAGTWNRSEIAVYLINQGANVNSADINGWTPLHEACEVGNIAIAKILLAAGARVEATDTLGRTPFDCADADLLRLLRR